MKKLILVGLLASLSFGALADKKEYTCVARGDSVNIKQKFVKNKAKQKITVQDTYNYYFMHRGEDDNGYEYSKYCQSGENNYCLIEWEDSDSFITMISPETRYYKGNDRIVKFDCVRATKK